MGYTRKPDDVALLLDELEGLEAPASSGKPLEIPLSTGLCCARRSLFRRLNVEPF